MITSNSGINRKRKRGIETARSILDASAELFAQRGFSGVTVREIADLAGIRESSIYNHFSSKAEILETLYQQFIREVPSTRPSDAELEAMLAIMEPEEIFKAILFHVGQNVKGTLSNIAMIINLEKFKDAHAAELYYRYVVREPANYYERLIEKMITRGMVRPVDARLIAEQYNYVSIALTKEYIMAQSGLADVHEVVAYMIRTLRFFCSLMKKSGTSSYETEQIDPLAR